MVQEQKDKARRVEASVARTAYRSSRFWILQDESEHGS